MESEMDQKIEFAVKKSIEASATAHIAFMALAFFLKKAGQQAPDVRQVLADDLKKFFNEHPAPSDVTVYDVAFAQASDNAVGSLLSVLREK